MGDLNVTFLGVDRQQAILYDAPFSPYWLLLVMVANRRVPYHCAPDARATTVSMNSDALGEAQYQASSTSINDKCECPEMEVGQTFHERMVCPSFLLCFSLRRAG